MAAGASAQKTGEPAASCDGPSRDVSVAAQADPGRSDAWTFTIRNNTKAPLTALSIGLGERSELHAAAFAEPLEIKGPTGWVGRFLYHEDSEFMHWSWSTSDPKWVVPPASSQTGFSLVLPPFPQRLSGNRYPDGAAVGPLSVSHMGFRAYFTTGACLWSRVVPSTEAK
jgi:hypothetical protein